MDSLKDILLKKADDIDIDAKLSDLELAQAELDRHFDGRVKTDKITKDGVLLVKVSSSVDASELRFNQMQIVASINKSSKQNIETIRSRVR